MIFAPPTDAAGQAPRRALPRRCADAGMACVLAVLSFASAGTQAAQFTLNPTRVHLDRDRASETLTLGNMEDRDISFEVEVKRWRQQADGSWQLTADDGLVVHPLVVTVPAGGKARFRVGTLSPVVAEEEAFRVELLQLPDPRPAQGAAVELLTKMSIPVFVQPQGGAVRIELRQPRLARDAVRVDLANIGDRYLAPQDSRLRLLDAQGRIVREESLATGYVLPGAALPLARPLNAGECARIDRIELALAEPAASVAVAVPTGAGRCAD